MEDVIRKLHERLRELRFAPPVTHVYNPLEYALEPYLDYYRRYGQGRKDTLLMGMNPGPWGMAQTGVPFGEVALVRDWLGIRGSIGTPSQPHPKRPVTGWDCHRSEVSGKRVWSWVKDRYGTPEKFFERNFIANYCPLLFLEESGLNRTPDKLPMAERKPLLDACDEALRAIVERLQPRRVIGIGRFAEGRAREALPGLEILTVSHPSPANPGANRGWGEELDRILLP